MKETIVLVVRRRVPSLNQLFSMNPWQRLKEKQQTQFAMLSAYGAFESGYATRTTFAQSTLSTAYGTLAQFLTTGQKTSNYQCGKSKSLNAAKKERK